MMKKKSMVIIGRILVERHIENNSEMGESSRTYNYNASDILFETNILENIALDEEEKKEPIIGSFINKQGLIIKTYEWNVVNPKGLIVLIHGYNSHLSLSFLKQNVMISQDLKDVSIIDYNDHNIYHGSWIQSFNHANYNVCGMDLQGHGNSEGINNQKLDILSYNDFVDDILHFIESKDTSDGIHRSFAHGRFSIYKKNLPIYIIGHSLGGNLALRILQSMQLLKDRYRKLNVKGCVVLSGMVSQRKFLSKFCNKYFVIPLVKLICRTFPSAQITPKTICKRCNYFNKYDEFIYKGGGTCRIWLELLKGVKLVQRDIWYIPNDIPLLFFHGKEDILISPSDVEEFFSKIDTEEKELVLLDNMEDSLVSESDNQCVLNKILEWLFKLSEE